MEPSATETAGVGAGLERIEAAVDAGSTDLKALGFWALVGRVKRDPAQIAAFADRIGRIDGKAFRARVRFRVPVWAGNLLLAGAAIAGGGAVWVAGETSSRVLSGVAVVAAGGIWSLAVHCPTHWAVGRLAGIRFTDYFIGGPPPPRPGLKSDYATYLRARPSSRVWMHASGAIATKIAPFVALALVPVVDAPGWAALLLLAMGVGEIATDLVFSVKVSDWKKVRREVAVVRAGR